MKLISSGWTVIIIGLSISLMILSFAFFHYYIPYNKQTGFENAFADQLQTEGSKLPDTKKRVKTANEMVSKKESDWHKYVEGRTPPEPPAPGAIDISENPYQLAIDTWKFRDNMQRAVNAQIVKGGIQLVGEGPTVPGPVDKNNVGGLLASYYNYPTIKFPVLIFNLGSISVAGTYSQIMNNVRSYKSMPHYLATTDGLRLSGTAPRLIGTYNLTIVGFIHAKKVFGAVPEVAASSTGGGFGGFGGGGGGAPFGAGSFGGRPGGGAPPGVPGMRGPGGPPPPGATAGGGPGGRVGPGSLR